MERGACSSTSIHVTLCGRVSIAEAEDVPPNGLRITL
jgi:hypothetical protein